MAPGHDDHPAVPWRLVLMSRNVWLLGLIQTSGAFASYMYMSWFPTYLQEGRNVAQVDSGQLASLVLAGGAIGCLSGGFLAGYIVRRFGNRVWSRRIFGFVVMAAAAVALMMSVQCESATAASLCAALASMCAQTQQATWWAVGTEISGRHLGALFGLMNSLGVPGALGSQLFMGRFADIRKEAGFVGREQWDPAFYVYGGVLFFGACCWLFLDPTRSAVERATPKKLPPAPAT
jgi:MFS family permease